MTRLSWRRVIPRPFRLTPQTCARDERVANIRELVIIYFAIHLARATSLSTATHGHSVFRFYVPRTCFCRAAVEGGDGGRQQHCAAPELQTMVQHVHPHTAPHHNPPPAPLWVVVPAEGGSLSRIQNWGRLADGGRGVGAREKRRDARVCGRASHNRPRTAAIQHRDGDGLEQSIRRKPLRQAAHAQSLASVPVAGSTRGCPAHAQKNATTGRHARASSEQTAAM
jgi:hypothetical protein